MLVHISAEDLNKRYDILRRSCRTITIHSDNVYQSTYDTHKIRIPGYWDHRDRNYRPSPTLSSRVGRLYAASCAGWPYDSWGSPFSVRLLSTLVFWHPPPRLPSPVVTSNRLVRPFAIVMPGHLVDRTMLVASDIVDYCGPVKLWMRSEMRDRYSTSTASQAKEYQFRGHSQYPYMFLSGRGLPTMASNGPLGALLPLKVAAALQLHKQPYPPLHCRHRDCVRPCRLPSPRSRTLFVHHFCGGSWFVDRAFV